MDERPDWWRENDALKARFDLPEYEPPRFSDGVYTHEVLPQIERERDCTVLFVGYNADYPEDWEVRVDNVPVMPIGRHRDDKGNTVYELSSTTFVDRLTAELE